jgi:hypothetical protein
MTTTTRRATGSFNPDNRTAATAPWGRAKREKEEEVNEAETEETEEDGQPEPESSVVQDMRRQVEELRQNQQRADQEKVNSFARLKREAVAAGDTETYDRLSKEENSFYQHLASTRGQQAQQGDAAVTQKWMEKNRWMSNHYLAGQAQAVAQKYADKGVFGAEQLRRVEREMREQFGDMISNYEGGNKSGSSPSYAGRSKRDWNSIPSSERKILTDTYFRKGAAQGLADTPSTRARMAKAWWDSNHPED